MRVGHRHNQVPRPLILVATVLVIIICVVFAMIYVASWQGPPQFTTDLTTFQAAGETAADETLKLLNRHGKIVVLVPNAVESKVPVVAAVIAGFTVAVQKQPGVTVVATEPVTIQDLQLNGLDKGLSPRRYRALVQQHPDVDAVVSLAGVPLLQDADWKDLPAQRPKFIAVFTTDRLMTSARLRKLFAEHVVQLAIIPRPAPPAGAKVPKTAHDRFEQLFMVTGAEQAAWLPDSFANQE